MSNDHERQSAPAEVYKPLLEATRKALAKAMFHAMQVAGEPENGYPTKLGQEALAERAGIARSTVTKYLSSKDSDESQLNPDLETVCKISAALNVPPAFLLMTPSDWSKLAQAATDAVSSSQDAVAKQIVFDLVRDRLGAAKRGETGLRLAERLGVYQYRRSPTVDAEDVPAHWAEAQAEARRRSQLGILSATALPPLSDLNAEQKIIIMSLCAILGASTNLK